MSAKKRTHIGDRAPDFTLPDQSGDDVTLSEVVGERCVVLFFYPKDNTPGCIAEACAFRDSFEAFTDHGARVIGISGDTVKSHKGFAGRFELPFTIVADRGNRVRGLYGVPSTMGLIPGRVTYVIDRKGVVRHIFRSQMNARGHVDESLKILEYLNCGKSGNPDPPAPPAPDA